MGYIPKILVGSAKLILKIHPMAEVGSRRSFDVDVLEVPGETSLRRFWSKALKVVELVRGF